MSGPTEVVLAGGTGGLGLRIARALRERGAGVKAVVRRGTAADRVSALQASGVRTLAIDLDDPVQVTAACLGADCVVSALNGLRPTILGTQSVLLDAAVAAGVPRFIPSDFSLDFSRTPPGSNRNTDLPRAFAQRLAAAPIQATLILNGAFMDMLTGQAPFILFGQRRGARPCIRAATVPVVWSAAIQRIEVATPTSNRWMAAWRRKVVAAATTTGSRRS